MPPKKYSDLDLNHNETDEEKQFFDAMEGNKKYVSLDEAQAKEFNFKDWSKAGHQIYEDYADSTKMQFNPKYPGVPMFEENAFQSKYTQEYEDALLKEHLATGGTKDDYLGGEASSMGDQRYKHFKFKLMEHKDQLTNAEKAGLVSAEDVARFKDADLQTEVGLSPSFTDERWGKNKGNRPIYYGEGDDQMLMSPFRLMNMVKKRYNPLNWSNIDDAMYWMEGKGEGANLLSLLHPYKKNFEYK